MNDITRELAEQRIKEYEMHMHRLDDLLGQAEHKATRNPELAEVRAQLEKLKQERHRLADWLEEARTKPLENWRQDEIMQAGPMGIWDAVAQQIEKLIERLER